MTAKTAARALRRVLFCSGSDVAELMIAMMTTGFGLWLMHPSYALSVGFTRFMSEWWWGGFALGIGLFSVWSLLGQYPFRRRWSSMAIAVFWLFISLLFTLEAPAILAFPIYWCLTLFSSWLYLRHLESGD